MIEKRRPAHPRPITPPSPREIEGKDPSKVELDWRAYFVEFCKTHGEPVEHGGVLIFRDGWSYSSTDYEGPEWSPPGNLDELDQMVTRYWAIRHSRCKRMLSDLVFRLQQFKDVIATRSLPVQQATYLEDGEGKRRRAYRKLDLTPLQSRIEWVRADLVECETRLKEIEDYQKQQRGKAS